MGRAHLLRLSSEAKNVLVTAGMHEWADLRRPAQPGGSRDGLNTHFYAFHVILGVLNLSSLPFTGVSGAARHGH